MTNREARERFIVRLGAAGVPYQVIRGVLSKAATLQRLAEAQCNGDWPYNGDRDRPSMTFRPCPCASADRHRDSPVGCLECQQTRLQTNGRERMRHDARYGVCPECEASGVAVSALKRTRTGPKLHHGTTYSDRICPDCRAAWAVRLLLAGSGYLPVFGGDPRGYVLKLAKVGTDPAEIDNGRAESRGDVIGVPA